MVQGRQEAGDAIKHPVWSLRWWTGDLLDLPPDRRARIAFRLSFLVLAAGGLAWVCQQGTSLLAVGLVFVVYVAAATLWIRGQHQASVDAAVQANPRLRPWTFPYRTSGLVAVVGVSLAVAGIVLDWSTVLLAGVLATYFAAGYLHMRFRTYAGDGGPLRVKVGASVLVAVVVLTVVGLFLLEASTWAVIPIASVLFAPVGLSLLAEPAIRSLQRPAQKRKVTAAALAFAGVALLAADVGIAVWRVDTAWIAYGFLALALLVVAIVSSTQADIAIAIAAVALMGFTAMSDNKPGALTPKTGDQRVLVALGDSYMSGEGADIFYNERNLEPSNHCNRAPTAWAAMAGRTKRLFDSVAFLACSGARTYNVRHVVPTAAGVRPNKPQYNEPGTQLDQVDALKKELGEELNPSLVVVGLGGNDAGFATIGMMCLAPGDCSTQRKPWEDNLANVGKALAATYDEIRREFPDAPVLVTAYPAPIATNKDGKPVTCDQVALSKKDTEFIGDFVTKLNDTVEQAATSKRFYFLGEMEQALADAHLQLCDRQNGERPGINFIGLRSVGGIAEQRFNPANWYHNSLHPNERGHAAMLQVFEQWRATHPHPPDDAPAGATAAAAASGAPTPPCDLVGGGPSTTARCLEEGPKWARGQLADTILLHGWGLQIGLATFAAWLLAVALFGWRKPWWEAS